MTVYHASLESLTSKVMGYDINLPEVQEDMKQPWFKIHFEKRLAKAILYLEQEGKCCFCNTLMYADTVRNPKKDSATIEHVQCRHHGGADDISNYKLSCYLCNNLRQTMDYDQFDNLIKKHGRDGYDLIMRAVKKDKKRQAQEKKKAHEKEQQEAAKIRAFEKYKEKRQNIQRHLLEQAYGALYKSGVYRKAA